MFVKLTKSNIDYRLPIYLFRDQKTLKGFILISSILKLTVLNLYTKNSLTGSN